MARKDALERMERKLVARRQELLRTISDDLTDLDGARVGPAGGDDADLASEMMNREIVSQLAELESRELEQIDLSLRRIRQGSFGECGRCGARIPLARLEALPFTNYCVECQRVAETQGFEDEPAPLAAARA